MILVHLFCIEDHSTRFTIYQTFSKFLDQIKRIVIDFDLIIV